MPVVKVNNQKTKFIGTWFAKHMDLSTGEQIDTGMKNLKNWWKINGEWLNEDDNDSVMVGSLFAGKNGIKVGDKIIFSKYAGTEVKLDKKEYIVVKIADVLAVVED